MDKQAFKQRMQNLKSYRENNPGKGYWDWKVEQFEYGGDNTPMWLQKSYSGPTYDQVLESLKKDDPAAYNRLAEARAREQNPTSEIVRYVDSNGNIASAGNMQGLQSVVTPEDLPGIGDAAEVYNIGKDLVEGNYGAAAAGLGLLAIPGGAAGKIYRNSRNILTTLAFKPNSNKIQTVNKLFRNKEWNNFLSTRNGDAYYRMQRTPGIVSTNVSRDNGGYFISHTTPWEEFSGLGSSENNGMTVLYEFPTQTFGVLKASNDKGYHGLNDVTEMGRKHLLYGDTSSGKRDFVRIMSDNDAELLDTSPYKIGIVDRPLTPNGKYDTRPPYENIHQGNQTTVSPETLNNAILNTDYNWFQHSPEGIIKGLYVTSYQRGGEVDEFQRKTRRDIMQESLVDGRPDYNKMFQNQNEYQKDFANYWYTERAKNPKYSDQIGGDKLSSVLSNIDKATWKTPTEAMRDNMVGQGYNPTDAQINQQLNILKEKGTKGFANPKSHSYTSLRPANTWHEGIGHMVGDNTPAILNAAPNVRISNPDSSYEDYVNQANEKHAQTWDFRGNNSNLKDDQGNYYIDPNRQLTPEDISNMRSKGAKIPEQWESLEDADISELTNTFAYNMYQDPVQYMANGGEVGDPDDEFTKSVNTKLGRTPDGRPLQQGLKPVFDLEDAANLTPVGDAIAAKDMYNAAMDKDWTGLGLAAATMIPFVPMSVRQFNKTYRGTKRISNKKYPKTSMAEHNISVNPSRMQDLINAAIEKGEKRTNILNNANNEVYKVAERIMEDPDIISRAEQVLNQHLIQA